MYKWVVYLNNKCSKEQPKAWSVVGKCEIKKNPKNHYHGAGKLEEMPFNTAQRRMLDTGNIRVSVFKDLKNFCQFSGSLRLKEEHLLHSLTVQHMDSLALSRAVKLRTIMLIVYKRQKAPCWALAVNNLHDRERASSCDDGDGDYEIWRKSENYIFLMFGSIQICRYSHFWKCVSPSPQSQTLNILSCKHNSSNPCNTHLSNEVN